MNGWDLRSTRIGDRALAQTPLDLGVARGLADTAGRAALATQPCGFARFLLRPTVRSSSHAVSFCLSYGVSSFSSAVCNRLPGAS